MKVAAIIPAFNEAEALPAVLVELGRTLPDVDVIVVDDGSADDTAAVARAGGATCLVLPFNLGIGGALRMGFRFAHEQGYERAFQFDADGQHEAGQVSALLEGLDAGADMVIGSRFAGVGDYQPGRIRGMAMGVLRFGIKRIVGRSFTDTSSGFRGFNSDVLALFARDYPVEYMDSVEALVMAHRAGFRVEEVPVTMRERAGGTASTRNFRLLYHYVRVLITVVLAPRRAGTR